MASDIDYVKLRPRPDFGAAIRAKRVELGVTVAQVADAAGLSEEAYEHLERRVHDAYYGAPLGKLARVAAALSTSLEELLLIPKCASALSASDLRMRRESLGLSVAKLSDLVGISDDWIAAAEDDPSRLQNWVLDPILALAKLLNVPLACLLELAASKAHT